MFCSRPEGICVRPSRQIVVSAFMDDSKAPKAPKAPKSPKKAKEDKEDKIKRAPSAYNLFWKATFQEVKRSSPEGTKTTELTGKLSQMWKELSDEQKRPYQAQADKLKGEVAILRTDAKAEAKKNAKPVTPFASFVASNYASVQAKHPGTKTTGVIKLVAEEWAKVPEEKKKAMTAEYQAQVAEWKSKQQ